MFGLAGCALRTARLTSEAQLHVMGQALPHVSNESFGWGVVGICVHPDVQTSGYVPEGRTFTPLCFKGTIKKRNRQDTLLRHLSSESTNISLETRGPQRGFPKAYKTNGFPITRHRRSKSLCNFASALTCDTSRASAPTRRRQKESLLNFGVGPHVQHLSNESPANGPKGSRPLRL